MAKDKKVVRYRKPFHLNIGFITFGIVFIYIMFYVFSYFTSDHTSVYEVVQGMIAVNSSYTGLILRSEETFNTDTSGAINYYVKDNSKIRVGDLIYSVDTNGAIAEQINSAGTDSSALDADDLSQIQESISDYCKAYTAGAFYNVYTFKNDLNAEISESLSMNALNAISDDVMNAESNATFHKSYASAPGIVVYYTDGFEDVTVDNFTAEMFDESQYQKNNLKDKTEINAGDAAYKLITDENWNIVFPVKDDTLELLKDSSTVNVRFKKDNTICRTPFSIVEKDGVNYLVLSLKNSMVRFASNRYIEIELIFDEETGLKIPNSAIAKKEFYMLPMEYFQKGGDSDEPGVIVRRTDKSGAAQDLFVAPNIYFSTEYSYYVDSEDIKAGDVLVKPNSSETYVVSETGTLEGVYNINKGYSVFKQIDVIYQNEEYSIIRSGTAYGISLYDHIALDGSLVTENALIN